MRALVLAGGSGTRLQPLTFTTSKQLIPIANKPILFYVIESILKAGIHNIGIIVEPKTAEQVIRAVEGYFDRAFTFIFQDEPKGLAHAVLCAKKFLKKDNFLMYLGDNLIEEDLNILEGNTIYYKQVNDPHRFGVVELENGKIVSLEEKPKEPKSNNALVGIYTFTSKIFDAISKTKPSARGELEITDAIRQLIDIEEVKAKEIIGYWLDMGKKDTLLEANKLILKNGVAIGENTVTQNCTIGNNVSIGKNCFISQCRLKDCVILDNNTLVGCTLMNALIGNNNHIEDLYNFNLTLGDGNKI